MSGPNERVLVTGGAGFIGSHLCDRLLSEGDRVLCLDNFDDFYDPAIKRANLAGALRSPHFTLLEGDICDPEAVARAFAFEPTVLVHLAALAGVRPSIERPDAYMRVNLEGTARLFQAAVGHDVERVVFASSSSVYGNRDRVPFHEDDRVDDPVSPYAASKKAGELLAHTFHELHGLAITSLRFFTVYGPRQRPEMAIHKFVHAVETGQPLTLFGDGTSSRDYTYIDDIIDGVVASIRQPLGCAILNLGEATPIALSDLVTAIEAATGKQAERRHIGDQAGDVAKTCASVERARELLGYAPKVPLHEGLQRFVNWYRGRPE